MVDERGHLKLVDFGLAIQFKKSVERISPKGSLVYMPPELLRDEQGGRHTDWWALLFHRPYIYRFLTLPSLKVGSRCTLS